jgi:hypothetical protein
MEDEYLKAPWARLRRWDSYEDWNYKTMYALYYPEELHIESWTTFCYHIDIHYHRWRTAQWPEQVEMVARLKPRSWEQFPHLLMPYSWHESWKMWQGLTEEDTNESLWRARGTALGLCESFQSKNVGTSSQSAQRMLGSIWIILSSYLVYPAVTIIGPQLITETCEPGPFVTMNRNLQILQLQVEVKWGWDRACFLIFYNEEDGDTWIDSLLVSLIIPANCD